MKVNSVKLFLYKFCRILMSRRSFIYPHLSSKQLSHKQTQTGSQHMPSADVTRNSLQLLKNCFIRQSLGKVERSVWSFCRFLFREICWSEALMFCSWSGLQFLLSLEHQIICLPPERTEQKKKKKRWFGLLFFLLELSVAYFCFFKFLMAIECGRELSDSASCQVLK